MAKIYVLGVSEPIDVLDAPDFQEACKMISNIPEGGLVIFETHNDSVAIIKERIILFSQGTEIEVPVVPTANAAFVVPSTPEAKAQVKPKKKKKVKRARPESIQSGNSE